MTLRYFARTFVALVTSGIMVACSNSDPDYTGKVATISDYLPCAGSIDAADTMDTQQYEALFGAKSKGEATGDALVALRKSGGIWLLKGWVVRFTGKQEYGVAKYTSLQVVRTAQYEGD